MDLWKEFVKVTKEPYFNPLISFFNVLLVFITGVISFLSWRAAGKANELQILPLLSIYFRGDTLRNRSIRIRNIGKSPAYDIYIEPFTLVVTDIQRIWKLELKMTGTNVLTTDEEKDLLITATVNGQKADIGDFMVFYLDPNAEHKRKRTSLLLKFKNAEGKQFISEIETGVGGLFVTSARRLNLMGWAYIGYKKIDETIFVGFHKLIWKFRKPYTKQIGERV